MVFGSYEHKIDEKNRVKIPSKLRTMLGDTKLYLSKGTNGCLNIFREKEIEALFEKLDNMSLTEGESSKGLRAFSASIVAIEEDLQGRFIIPQTLISFAGVKKNTIFVGVGKRVELWSEERWNNYNAGSDNFDDAFNKLKNEGI